MKTITTERQWEQVKEESFVHPVVIFKGSKTCPTTAAVQDDLNSYIEENPILESVLYYIVVQDAPTVSRRVAEETVVMHETPQIIVLKDGRAVYNESHHGIVIEEIEEILEEYTVHEKDS